MNLFDLRGMSLCCCRLGQTDGEATTQMFRQSRLPQYE